MSEARQHHFVPQCYLKGFTHNGSKNSALYVIDLAEARSFTTVPAKVAKQRDFNRVDGLPAGELDNRLSGFETKLASALEKIGAARKVDDADAWLYVINLMGLLAIRNPRMRENVRQSYEEMAMQALQITLATAERWEAAKKGMVRAGVMTEQEAGAVPYEKLRTEVRRPGAYRVEPSPGWHSAMEFKTFDKVLPHLAERRWLLCVAAPDAGTFITSDHPVCLMHSDGTAGGLARPVGFGLAQTSVVFPVNRSILAVGTFEGTGGVRELTALQVGYFNAMIASYADRQLYAADDRFRSWLPGGRVGRGDDMLRHLAEQRDRRKAEEKRRR